MWSSKVLAQYCQAEHHGAWVEVERVVTDSRAVRAGDLFVALQGERFDGHQYVEQAIASGAAALLVSAEIQVPPHIAKLVAGDCLRALQQMAKADRSTFSGPVIAVTGSNGKTTTKELLASLLRAHYGQDAVLATQGNLNNHIGVPLTLLQRRESHRVLVIEMGMNHFGELSLLSDIAAPNIAVITNAGPAHLEGVGSVAGVAKAKGEIFDGLSECGVAVINGDDYFAPYWEVLNKDRRCIKYGLSQNTAVQGHYSEGVLTARLVDKTAVSLQPPFKGRHNAQNALAALAVGEYLGIPAEVMRQGLEAAVNVDGRLRQFDLCAGISLIDDSYNANPASVLAATKVLAQEQGKRILVLGDIGELGADSDNLHVQLLSEITQHGFIDHVLTLGRSMGQAAEQLKSPIIRSFEGRADLVLALVGLLSMYRVDGATVLVKGSRFMAMEKVIVELKDAVKGEA